jgi:hypothetical protein
MIAIGIIFLFLNLLSTSARPKICHIAARRRQGARLWCLGASLLILRSGIGIYEIRPEPIYASKGH